MIVATPLSKKSYARRGYNQSAMLGKGISRRTGIPFLPQALQKVRETRDQVGLTREERRKNLLDAFQAEPCLVKNRSVLIVDDVMTTGAAARTYNIMLSENRRVAAALIAVA